MRVGFFGGSFDPIHLGHINLAIELKERRQLDEVWLFPANISPAKGWKPIAGSLRLQMAQLAVKDIPGFKVLDDELKRKGPSYTVQTLRDLHQQYPKYEWHLLLGEDSLKTFLDWKEPNEILKLASPLIGARDSKKLLAEANWSQDQKIIFENGWEKVPIFEISSTEIRSRLANKLYCGHLLPGKVLDFIIKNGLYSDGYEKSRPA